MKTIAVILGTRPEIIKLAPLILSLREDRRLNVKVISSGQHQSMAEQAFKIFGIQPDIDLGLMSPNQTPNSFLGSLMPELQRVLSDLKPAGVVVQGDTTTALGAALSAFHLRIPVAHVEAGLRTGDTTSPFPEEMNRVLIGSLASIHFCHTVWAQRNLEKEGHNNDSFVVGNTVIDALFWVLGKLDRNELEVSEEVKKLPLQNKRMILVTGHRRENFDQPLRNLCKTLDTVVQKHSDTAVVYPVHLNPNVQQVVQRELADHERVHLIAPVNYPTFVWLMRQSALIVSDSGGVQEEAPSLGKHVIVTRKNTERPEAVSSGYSEVANLNEPAHLLERIEAVLAGDAKRPAGGANPYGDGKTSERICAILSERWG